MRTPPALRGCSRVRADASRPSSRLRRPESLGGDWPRPSGSGGPVASERLADLDLHRASGMWRISSDGTTVYFLDLDRNAVVRVPGDDAPRFPFDKMWAPLVHVVSYNVATATAEPGVVRIGLRPRYTFDPGPQWPSEEWRIQRSVTAIELVAPAEAEHLRAQYTTEAAPSSGHHAGRCSGTT